MIQLADFNPAVPQPPMVISRTAVFVFSARRRVNYCPSLLKHTFNYVLRVQQHAHQTGYYMQNRLSWNIIVIIVNRQGVW